MRYWAYINNEIKGPFEPDELIKIDGFSSTTLVCPQSSVEEDTKEWKEAREIPELAIFTSSKLPTEKEEEIKTSELQQTQKKEEIIIERFGIENLFAPAQDIDIDKTTTSSTDPLTLSQIRRRVETTQKDIETVQNIDNREEQKINIIEEPPNELPSSPPLEMPKETIEEFQIPSTDELLKTIEKNNKEITPSQPYFETIPTTEKEEPRENLENTNYKNTSYIDEAELSKKIDDKLYQFREIILNEIDKKIEENLETIRKEFLQKFEINQQKNNPDIDIQKLKDEIIANIDLKISSLSQNQQQPVSLNPSDESFKKDFDELKTLVRHIEIEVRDLRTRTESIENKVKTEPVGLSRENLPKQNNITLNTSSNEPEEKPKKDKKNNILKIILTVLLIPVALGSILFMLKQFGIFDFTALFSSKEKKQEINQTMSPEQPPITHQTILPNTTEQIYIQSSTETNMYTDQDKQQENIKNQEKQSKTDTKADIPLESIINEVKDYKIKSPHNLEKTIAMILKSRKADLSSIKWDAQRKDEENKYLITVTAKASKPIEFKFEFDFKTKILQPLNTLSINTLKMMMEETRETKKVSKTITTKQTQRTEQKRTPLNKESKTKPETKPKAENVETDEDGQVFVDETKSQNTEIEEENTEDYLIIGE